MAHKLSVEVVLASDGEKDEWLARCFKLALIGDMIANQSGISPNGYEQYEFIGPIPSLIDVAIYYIFGDEPPKDYIPFFNLLKLIKHTDEKYSVAIEVMKDGSELERWDNLCHRHFFITSGRTVKVVSGAGEKFGFPLYELASPCIYDILDIIINYHFGDDAPSSLYSFFDTIEQIEEIK